MGVEVAMTELEPILDVRAIVGEGPIWDDERRVLLWVDILDSALYVYDPATGENRAFDVGQHVGTVVPWRGDEVMVAVRHGFASFDLATGALTPIHDPEEHLSGNRFNDGKCDPAGRFWAGTMAYDDPQDQGSLYRMDADRSVHKVMGDIGIANGIVWSLDRSTMYYIDTVRADVRAYDYDQSSGEIANERVAIAFPDGIGRPDGMAIDEEGLLWIAHYGGGRVCRWDPDRGEIVETVRLPTANITACAFGGAELDTLYVTSAGGPGGSPADGSDPAGGLFSLRPGVRGVPAFRFGG